MKFSTGIVFIWFCWIGQSFGQQQVVDKIYPDSAQYVVDGTVWPVDSVRNINAGDLKSLTILKSAKGAGDHLKQPLTYVIETNRRNKMRLILDPGSKSPDDPLLIVDGKEWDFAHFAILEPESISTVRVLREPFSTALYGKKGMRGVLLVSLKNNNKNDLIVKDAPIKMDGPLLIIDDKEAELSTLEQINYKAIEKIQVFKNSEATVLYGSKGIHGVIIINTKNNKNK
jgi:hypothetical protein